MLSLLGVERKEDATALFTLFWGTWMEKNLADTGEMIDCLIQDLKNYDSGKRKLSKLA